MSPASNSKLKDKSTAKPGKEPKAHSNGSFNVTTSAYRPISGKVHALETEPSSTDVLQIPQANRCSPNVVDLLEQYQLDEAFEYDSVSNIDSLSSECNDLQKDGNNNSNTNNASSHINSIPGSDANKQEKIKLKNEKKHQRRKERRAQELHENCCSYLTSRKLESLAQHLVSMGFTSEAATTALIHNEGRLEASASWILDGGFERKQNSKLDRSNNKIDISDELSKIKEFESRFKCSKQDVEKAVVACEGDLQMAVEALKTQFQKLEVSAVSENLKVNSDQPTISPANARIQPVKLAAESPPVQLHRRDDGNVDYTKPKSTISTQVYRPLKKVQSTTEAFASSTIDNNSSNNNNSSWLKVNQNVVPSPSEKRWLESTTMGTPLQQIQTATQLNTDMNTMTESSTGNGHHVGQQMQNLTLASRSNTNAQQLCSQDQYHHMQYVPSLKKPPKGGTGYYDNMHGTNTTRSSMGVFTNLPSSGSSTAASSVDWSSHKNDIPFCDYTNIDWSLDSAQLGLPLSSIKGEHLYDKALHASSLFSSKLEFSRPASNGGENGNLKRYGHAKGPTTPFS